MGRSTEAIQFKVGDTVGLRDHQGGLYYLHEVHKSDPGFLVIGTEGAQWGLGAPPMSRGQKERK